MKKPYAVCVPETVMKIRERIHKIIRMIRFLRILSLQRDLYRGNKLSEKKIDVLFEDPGFGAQDQPVVQDVDCRFADIIRFDEVPSFDQSPCLCGSYQHQHRPGTGA